MMKQKWEAVEEILHEVGGVDIDDAKQVYHMAICDLCEVIMRTTLDEQEHGKPLIELFRKTNKMILGIHGEALDVVHALIIKEQLVKYKSIGGHVN